MTTRVAITLSDPWDLVTTCGSGPFTGTVLDAVSTGILIELDVPLKHVGQEFVLARCQARHTGTTTVDLLSTRDTPANIALLARNDAPPRLFTDAQLQRGVGAIGMIAKLT